MRASCTWIVVTLALLLAASSSADPGGGSAPTPFTDFDVLRVGQTACLFDCPVFEVEIFSDGRVRHSGPTFARTGGPHESRIERRSLARIAQALRDARIDEMRERYEDGADGCESTMTDMSTLYFRVSRGAGSRVKSVALYAGCLGPAVPAERINALIKAIDQVTGTKALIEQRKHARRPHGEAVAPSK